MTHQHKKLKQREYYFFASPNVQARVELRVVEINLRTLHRQLQEIGVTHVLFRRGKNLPGETSVSPFAVLREAGCLELEKSMMVRVFASRTLPGMSSAIYTQDILRLRGRECLP